MISDPALVLYTCIAHQQTIDSPDSMILAEFKSTESSLQQLAQQCLQHTPPHHSIYTQTSRNQTFTFLSDYPFVYFGIFKSKMTKTDQIELFDNLKATLNHIIKDNPDQKFTPFCFQGELDHIFNKLLLKSSHFDGKDNAPMVSVSSSVSSSGSSKGRKIMALPMLNNCKIAKLAKKKRVPGDSVTDGKEALVDGKVDVLDNWDDDMNVKSREINSENGVFLVDARGNNNNNVGRQKAKKIWRQYVWIVLMLDLAVCLILFGIWLFVCRGFECIQG